MNKVSNGGLYSQIDLDSSRAAAKRQSFEETV